MSQYTDQERVERFLNRDLTANEATDIDSLIESVSNRIDAFLGRTYQDVDSEDEVTETTRYYDGSAARTLFIDDALSISSLQLLDTYGNVYETIIPADYILDSTNGTIKDTLTLRHRRFPGYVESVKITGQFSSGPVPEEVVRAATEMVAGSLKFNTDSQQEFESESIEGYSYKRMKGDTVEGIYDKHLSKINHLQKITF